MTMMQPQQQGFGFEAVNEQQAVVQSELRDGERLLWADRPDPQRALKQAFVIWIFAIPWTAFAVFWIVMAATMSSGAPGPGSFFALFGLPFLLIGFVMLASPWWAQAKAKRTTYAITDQRVLIIETGKTRKVESYSADDLGNISRVERPDRSGDLTFAQKSYRDSDNDRRSTDIKFVGVREVRQVENILRDTFKK